MVKHIFNAVRLYILLLGVLMGIAPAVAQDRAVLAHLVTGVAGDDGCLARLDTKTSTRYTQLETLSGSVGFFYGDKHYISLKDNRSDDASSNNITYTVLEVHTLKKVEQTVAYADCMLPTSAVFHPADSVVYVSYLNSETNTYSWGALQFDAEENILKPSAIPSVEMKKPFYAMCATPEGEVYGFGADAGLYRIDKTTGEGEKLFSTGAVGKEQQSAWYDEVSGMIYRSVSSSIGVTIYSYNLTDKQESFLKVYTSVAAIVAMAPEVEAEAEGVPMQVNNLAVILQADLKTGTICFVAPTTDIKGIALVDTLSHAILVDNVLVDTLKALPGEYCKYDYIFTDGAHSVAVFAVNEYGEGQMSEYRFFAGYDLPKPVGEVAVSCNFPLVDVAWTLPVGENGETVDIENLRYRVVRFPDGVLVADTTATQVTDSLPSVPGTYYYGVTAYLPDYSTSATLSASFYYDCPLGVPYVLNKWDEDVLSAILIEDANQDGATWGRLEAGSGEVFMRYLYSSVNAADDYLYLPQIMFNSGVLYEVSLYLHAGSEKYEEYFSVGVVPSDDLLRKREYLTQEKCAGKQSREYKLNFSVEQDGEYRLYIHCVSPANRHMLYVDSVSITVLENRNTPAAVSDLVLTPDRLNPHIVTIDFTSPTCSTDGSLLEALREISIYRNDEFVYSFEQPNLGAPLSYCDSVGDIANYTYKVVAANEYGAGVEAVQEVVRGVAPFPFQHDFVDGLGYFTICDNNADGITWHYYEDRFMGCMRYMSSADKSADDWLISPPMYLSDKIRYQIEYSCCAGLSIYPESMRVLLGRTPQPNAMSAVVSELQDFTFINDTCIVAPFDIVVPGYYYLAFQANSRADSYAILLRNMAINEYDPMSVGAVAVGQCRIWGGYGYIGVQDDCDAVVEVYDVAGNKVATFVATSGITTQPLSAGIYIVRCGSNIRKIVVR